MRPRQNARGDCRVGYQSRHKARPTIPHKQQRDLGVLEHVGARDLFRAVTRRHVRDLMRQHPGEFGLAPRVANQTGVDE